MNATDGLICIYKRHSQSIDAERNNYRLPVGQLNTVYRSLFINGKA